MRERLKNDLLILLDKYVSVEVLREMEPQLELLISNYEIEEREL